VKVHSTCLENCLQFGVLREFVVVRDEIGLVKTLHKFRFGVSVNEVCGAVCGAGNEVCVNAGKCCYL
jgi:hypothetical protein